MTGKTWKEKQKRLFEIVEVGAGEDRLSRGYDLLIVLAIVVNLIASVLFTFDTVEARFGGILDLVELVTVLFFAFDYVLRLLTAKYLRPQYPEKEAVLRYAVSFTGIVDLLSFLPYFLPIFFPAGIVAFRMFRIVRIFRLFRLSAYYDSLNVISEVIINKKQQLLSSLFILIVLMLASSLCMYSLEHKAQPDVFRNAFSGIWWAVSTLLTVGYGDIYPITALGRVFGIILTFLGVGMVAIPTGIISAGFVEQYSVLKRRSEYIAESDVRFIRVHLVANDAWVGKRVDEIILPHGLILAAIRRGRDTLVPHGEELLLSGDTLVLGAEPYPDREHIDLQEIVLGPHHPWVGQRVKDLDVSRQTLIVMVRRKEKNIIPHGKDILLGGDRIFVYSESKIEYAGRVEL